MRTSDVPDEHFSKLERMYESAPINRIYSPTMIVSQGRAEITMPVDDRLFHAAGAVHGSVYFKALDDAAFFAANSVVAEVFRFTVSFSIQLLGPVSHGTVKLIGILKNESRRVLVADAEVLDDNGKLVARGSGLFIKSEIPLNEDVGYQ